MKKITLIVATIATSILTSYSQSLNYNDLGILFSKTQPNNGSARFNAMAGTFGALGSDISSIEINPAGAAVARRSKASITLQNRNLNRDINYYGNTNNIQDQQLDINQAGFIFVVDDFNSNDWNRFAFSLNYQTSYNFDNYYAGKGNSNFMFYNEHIDDISSPKNDFNGSINQKFSYRSNGQKSSVTIGFSGAHDNNLFVGASIKFHSLEFRETSLLNEVNDDAAGNILDVDDYNQRFINGYGASFNLGFIYKVNKFLRIGASYESPTWYTETLEKTENRLTMFGIENLNFNTIEERNIEGPYSLNFRSPGKLTASGALIFGKKGLLSFDYSYKDYSNFRYSEEDDILQEANDFFNTDYRATHSLRVGTEWRFDKMSLRGGYFYEKNPNLIEGGATNKDNLRGFTTGLGYKFGNTQIDLSYARYQNSDFFTLYNLEDINIENNTSKISATVTFNL